MEESHLPTLAPARRVIPFVAAIVVAAGGIGYAIHEHHSAQSLETQNQQMATQLNATHSELDSLVAKVNTLATAQAPADASPTAASAAKPSPVTRAASGSHPPSHRGSALDPRFNKMQSQLDAQGKAIDDTRSDLTSARTELTGSIARTHDELVLLQKRGERNYIEFDIQKSKDFKREGPVSLSLRKSNVKRQYADLELIVDDRTVTQKHVNLFQPAMFYQPDSPQPMEIVINDISKDHIHGYISSPKYRQSELAATTDASAGPAANANPQLSVRQKLPLPADSGPVQP